MICKVRNTINAHSLISQGDTVIVGLSGGADSISLLNSLLTLSEELGITVKAAHVNHGLRGEEADRDEEFVRKFCKANNVELFIKRFDVRSVASQTGESTEECGRRLRYEFFASFGENVKIATAHNLNDRIETFLFNFSRGTSLNGLSSIPYKRGNIIRPLLDCSRNEIEDFCQKNSLDFVTDSTNADVHYSRNRIRNNVIPELKKLNPAIESAALRLFNCIDEDKTFIDSYADEMYSQTLFNESLISEKLLTLSPCVAKRIISKFVAEKCSILPDSRVINEIYYKLSSHGKVQISGNVFCVINSENVRIAVIENCEQWRSEFINNKAIYKFGEAEIVCSDIPARNISEDYIYYAFDADSIVGELFVRSRLDGDLFRPAGRNCSKTLKKLFNEKHIQLEERNKVPVLCDSNGIIAVEGFGVDERAALNKNTQNKISVIFRRYNND